MEQLSKIEIINNEQKLIDLVRQKGLTANDWNLIKSSFSNAMDIHSKQTAIAFANFINEKQYIENGSKNGVWYKRGGGVNSYTTERLYELFLKSLNK